MPGQKVTITTAYNVEIEYSVATVWDRIFAFFIDAVVKYGYVMLVGIIFFQRENEVAIWIYVLFCLPFFFYSLVFELFNNGKTIGKKAMNIQVVSLTGRNITTGQLVIRWFARLIDFFLFTSGLAFLSAVSSGKGQRIGDILAETTVISYNKHTLRQTRLSHVNLPKGYKGQYKEVMMLKDQDIQLLKEAVFNYTPASSKIQLAAAEHIMKLTGIPKMIKAKKYLKMIVYDYNYFQRLEEKKNTQQFLKLEEEE